MDITRQEEQAILRLVEQGVGAIAGKLAKISRSQWDIRTLSQKANDTPEEYLELPQPGQYFVGAYCQAVGKMFLSYFTPPSAASITRAFLGDRRQDVLATPHMQEIAVAEVSNIVTNEVAGRLADSCGLAFLLASPKSVQGTRAEIMKAAFGNFAGTGKIFSAHIHMSSKEIAADCALMLMLDDLIVNYILNAIGG
jgi:hypothetical protein